MPHKNKCSKCGHKHLPPTGKKCQLDKQLDHKDSESDMNLKELSMLSNKKSMNDASMLSGSSEESFEVEESLSVQSQILRELQKVNARLDAVEGQVGCSNGGARHKERQLKEQSKLSSTGSDKHCVKKVKKSKKNC